MYEQLHDTERNGTNGWTTTPEPRVTLRNGSARKLRPSRTDAEEAVRTLLSYVGDDPTREGLLETPSRVVRAFGEFFAGYDEDPEAILAKTFEEVGGYDEMVLVRDIDFTSHCEHHMVSFHGKAHVAYIPNGRVVGLSKLGRVVDVFARRLQVQEKLTVQIANAIETVLRPKGVAVVVEAEHCCMSTRGVRKRDAKTETSRLTGAFREDPALRAQLFSRLG